MNALDDRISEQIEPEDAKYHGSNWGCSKNWHLFLCCYDLEKSQKSCILESKVR